MKRGEETKGEVDQWSKYWTEGDKMMKWKTFHWNEQNGKKYKPKDILCVVLEYNGMKLL